MLETVYSYAGMCTEPVECALAKGMLLDAYCCLGSIMWYVVPLSDHIMHILLE